MLSASSKGRSNRILTTYMSWLRERVVVRSEGRDLSLRQLGVLLTIGKPGGPHTIKGVAEAMAPQETAELWEGIRHVGKITGATSPGGE